MISLLIRPGDLVACEIPAYYAFLELLGNAGAQLLPIPVRSGDGVDPDEAIALLEEFRPKMFYLCSSLSNPSGCTTPLANRQRLAEACARLGIQVVEDDIYGELLDRGPLRPLLSMGSDVSGAYVSSFSKSVAPGLRVGYLVSKQWTDAAGVVKCCQDMHGAMHGQMIMREYVRSGELEPHLDWLRIRNIERRQVAEAAVRSSFPTSATLHSPIGGYMLWVELDPATDLKAAAAECRKHGVVFAAGTVFYPNNAGIQAIRLNCARATLDELKSAIEIVGKSVSAH
jgi:2-aminoadipate transaminase